MSRRRRISKEKDEAQTRGTQHFCSKTYPHTLKGQLGWVITQNSTPGNDVTNYSRFHVANNDMIVDGTDTEKSKV